VRSPLLTDISIDWGGLAVADVYPNRIPDLFGATPVIVSGRYTAPGRGLVRLRGRMAGREAVREIAVYLPSSEPSHDVLASLWARKKIEDLMSQDYAGLQRGAGNLNLKDAITKLGIEFRLLTQFTSFVAVEETIVTVGGEPKRIDVPVEMPDGVSYEGVFGARGEVMQTARMKSAGMGGNFAAVVSAPGAMRREMTFADANEAHVSARPSKLHPDLQAIVARLEKRLATLAPAEAMVANQSLTGVMIWLKDTPEEALNRLISEAGFQLVSQSFSGKILIGRVPIGKLAALAKLDVVTYVSPAPL
jgi:Ca-activated chloride channel family protein